MKKYRHDGISVRIRKTTGVALIQVALACMLLVVFFVSIFMLAINMRAGMEYSGQIRSIAAESTKVIIAEKFWLGFRRPDYDPAVARVKASAVASRLCQLFSLPAPERLKFDESDADGKTYVSCKITVDKLRMPFGGFAFPALWRTTEGYTASESLTHPYAVLNIEAPGVDQSGNPSGLQGVQIPAIGYFKGYTANTSNALLSTGNALSAGFGSGGGALCKPSLNKNPMWVGGLYVAHPGDSPTFYDKLHEYTSDGTNNNAVSVQ